MTPLVTFKYIIQSCNHYVTHYIPRTHSSYHWSLYLLINIFPLPNLVFFCSRSVLVLLLLKPGLPESLSHLRVIILESVFLGLPDWLRGARARSWTIAGSIARAKVSLLIYLMHGWVRLFPGSLEYGAVSHSFPKGHLSMMDDEFLVVVENTDEGCLLSS